MTTQPNGNQSHPPRIPMSNPLPDTIRTIIEQCGGRGLHGAFCYVGASELAFRCPQSEGSYRSGFRSKTEDGTPGVTYEVGLRFRVNGRRGQAWTMFIVYEPDDTYTVWLVRLIGRARRFDVIACHRDVYCDTLKEVVEDTYDEGIRAHNEGFIPL